LQQSQLGSCKISLLLLIRKRCPRPCIDPPVRTSRQWCIALTFRPINCCNEKFFIAKILGTQPVQASFLRKSLSHMHFRPVPFMRHCELAGHCSLTSHRPIWILSITVWTKIFRLDVLLIKINCNFLTRETSSFVRYVRVTANALLVNAMRPLN
jgi:hypothetical protein